MHCPAEMKYLILMILISLVYAKHEEYIGWKSYYVKPFTDDQFKAFNYMVDKYELDILCHPIQEREGVLLVKAEHQAAFIENVKVERIDFRIHCNDVKSRLDYDDQLLEIQKRVSKTRNGGHQLPYDSYQEIEVIDNYLDYIGNEYPGIATVINAGNSFEGHPIKYIKISTTNFEDHSKPVIFIDGGIHAREWVSPPTVTWAIHKLVENLTENDLLDNFDWILLPVVNPDGYKFTFSHSRFWRKTRSNDTHYLSRLCPGVDGNRNYDFFWNSIGTSETPCSDIYAGNRVFSEVETRVVRDILHEHLPRMALYLTMHSFGSMILYPWGHDGSLSQNSFTLHTVGVAMADAIDKHSHADFPPYVVGNSALVLKYKVSGASEDYAHYIGVPLAYTIELPGLSNTAYGFHLDPIYIEQVCRATWEGIVVGVKLAGELFKSKSN